MSIVQNKVRQGGSNITYRLLCVIAESQILRQVLAYLNLSLDGCFYFTFILYSGTAVNAYAKRNIYLIPVLIFVFLSLQQKLIFQSPESYFAQTPGLKVVIPRSPSKAKATYLFRALIFSVAERTYLISAPFLMNFSLFRLRHRPYFVTSIKKCNHKSV